MDTQIETRQAVVSADTHPALVYLASLGSEVGRRTMRSTLEGVARMLSSGQADMATLDWSALAYQHVAAVRAQLGVQGKAPATINRTMAALRGVARACWLLGYTSAETYQRIREVRGDKGTRPPRGRELTHGELSALFRACAKDDTPLGVRDAAIFALLYGAGLRRAELCALTLADYTAGTLRVQGKGNRVRLAPIDDGAKDALEDWLAARGDEPGALLWPSGEGKGRLLVNRPITADAIYHICLVRAKDADVPVFRPHDMRRTFVSHLLEAKVDLSIVSRLAGHADLTTTARYDMRGEVAKRAGAKTLHVPYQKREST